MLFEGGSGQDLPVSATFRPDSREMSVAEKRTAQEEYRIWRAQGNPRKSKSLRRMVRRVMVVLAYMRRFREAAYDREAQRRSALLKPPGPRRKQRDKLLIIETLERLAWFKRLPNPSAAAEAPWCTARGTRRIASTSFCPDWWT